MNWIRRKIVRWLGWDFDQRVHKVIEELEYRHYEAIKEFPVEHILPMQVFSKSKYLTQTKVICFYLAWAREDKNLQIILDKYIPKKKTRKK